MNGTTINLAGYHHYHIQRCLNEWCYGKEGRSYQVRSVSFVQSFSGTTSRGFSYLLLCSTPLLLNQPLSKISNKKSIMNECKNFQRDRDCHHWCLHSYCRPFNGIFMPFKHTLQKPLTHHEPQHRQCTVLPLSNPPFLCGISHHHSHTHTHVPLSTIRHHRINRMTESCFFPARLLELRCKEATRSACNFCQGSVVEVSLVEWVGLSRAELDWIYWIGWLLRSDLG